MSPIWNFLFGGNTNICPICHQICLYSLGSCSRAALVYLVLLSYFICAELIFVQFCQHSLPNYQVLLLLLSTNYDCLYTQTFSRETKSKMLHGAINLSKACSIDAFNNLIINTSISNTGTESGIYHRKLCHHPTSSLHTGDNRNQHITYIKRRIANSNRHLHARELQALFFLTRCYPFTAVAQETTHLFAMLMDRSRRKCYEDIPVSYDD